MSKDKDTSDKSGSDDTYFEPEDREDVHNGSTAESTKPTENTAPVDVVNVVEPKCKSKHKNKRKDKPETKDNKPPDSTLKKKIKKVVKITLLTVSAVIVIGITVVCVKYGKYVVQARDNAVKKEALITDKTFRRAGYTEIYASDGKEIAKFASKEYYYKSLGDISPNIQHGFIAVEDQDFLKHGGISIKGLARATYIMVKNHGKATQGGSTITQQLVKNVFLNQDRTVSRKLEEIFLAMTVEKRFTKNQVLEFYLNNIYFGNGCYGIESASQHYFSKPSINLTVAESATLCALPNNPTIYNPQVHPENVIVRRNLILKDLLGQKYITQKEYDTALKNQLVLRIKKTETQEENYETSYAIDCTTRQLMGDSGFQFRYSFTDEKDRQAYTSDYKEVYSEYDKKIRSGGYQIYTDIDINKQKMLQQSVDSGLSAFTDTDAKTGKYKMQGAAVTIDNNTGMVCAIVGGRGESDTFNRAFLAYRQPGSSIKPLVVYTPAMEKGYHPLSHLVDQELPQDIKNSENKFFGDVTMRYAIEMSLNTVPFQLLQRIGTRYGVSFLEKLQFSKIHYQDYNPIVAIGGFTEGCSPIEQAGGYAALERKGFYTQPTCVKKVVYFGMDNLYERKEDKEAVYSPETSYMMTDILKGVISTDYGTGKDQKIAGQIVAGKTGTTSDCKDGWFCGYSAYYTTAVWCGYDTPTYVDNLYGATYPGTIWKSIMTQIHAGLPSKDFEKPSGIVTKNINGNGEITDKNTSLTDMFSEPILDEQSKEEDKRKQELELKQREEWVRQEPVREKSAEAAVKAYEAVQYTSKDTFVVNDNVYDSAVATLIVIDNKDIAKKLQDRLDIHKNAIAPVRKALKDAMDKEEEKSATEDAQRRAFAEEANKEARDDADKKYKEYQSQAQKSSELREQQSEISASSAVQILEALSPANNPDSVNKAIADAQNAVSKVTNSTKYNDLNTRLNNKIKDLGK